MSNQKPINRGKGYYIALALCAAALGVTGYVYYRTAQPVTQEVAVQETYEDVLVGTVGTEDVPVLATQPRAQTPGTTPATRETTPAATEKKTLKTASPVSGGEICGYSMEALSYNQTTRDWRVHNGIDLAAEAGAEVLAAADGKVLSVVQDEALGCTVTISHLDGYATSYASLAEEACVAPGDTVTLGQTIGYASDTAITEATLGSHVHFSVTQYGEQVDPARFLAAGN